MAEDFVTRDQHRADLTQLHLELVNTLASLDKRTELIAQDLTHLRQEMQQGFADLRSEMGAQRTETHRETDGLRQETQGLRQDTRREIDAVRTELHALRAELGAEMRAWRQTIARQLWVMVGLVTSVVLAGLIKLVLFP